MRTEQVFADVSSVIAKLSGRPATFILACLLVILWAVVGPLFHFSDTWQLIVNTGSSIATFLMVFLIQNAQARDSEAIQAKLDELIRVKAEADNSLIGIERLPDREIEKLRTERGDKPDGLSA